MINIFKGGTAAKSYIRNIVNIIQFYMLTGEAHRIGIALYIVGVNSTVGTIIIGAYKVHFSVY